MLCFFNWHGANVKEYCPRPCETSQHLVHEEISRHPWQVFSTNVLYIRVSYHGTVVSSDNFLLNLENSPDTKPPAPAAVHHWHAVVPHSRAAVHPFVFSSCVTPSQGELHKVTGIPEIIGDYRTIGNRIHSVTANRKILGSKVFIQPLILLLLLTKIVFL